MAVNNFKCLLLFQLLTFFQVSLFSIFSIKKTIHTFVSTYTSAAHQNGWEKNVIVSIEKPDRDNTVRDRKEVIAFVPLWFERDSQSVSEVTVDGFVSASLM